VEITRAGGGLFRQVLVNRTNPFPHGNAWLNGNPIDGVDLAGTLLEEESHGAATRETARFIGEPEIAESDRSPHAITIRWATAQPSDSTAEFAAFYPPYTDRVSDTNLVTQHVITLTNLLAHTPYHWRVQSSAPDKNPAISRDKTICTLPLKQNLLANPGFEQGTGPSPRSTIPGWNKTGALDMRLSDGTWFWGVPPRTGNWLVEGAANASSSEGYLYQRVKVTRGTDYTFSAWITTWMRENDTWKYDVWNDRNRLIHVRLGIDPTGGTNPTATSVRWTPRNYSHLDYSNLAIVTAALADYITVFIAMQGQGGQWHLYGVDDCVLTETQLPPPRLVNAAFEQDCAFAFTILSAPAKTNNIDVCTELGQWSSLATVVNATGQTRFRDITTPPAAQRFYRAVLP
ncbi:MAG: hypothetical protein QHJ82_13565, partial [Verrucomicrobiota bacterium]|nr:hypothetical protein [Verrucomicrobiota bacterium]